MEHTELARLGGNALKEKYGKGYFKKLRAKRKFLTKFEKARRAAKVEKQKL